MTMSSTLQWVYLEAAFRTGKIHPQQTSTAGDATSTTPDGAAQTTATSLLVKESLALGAAPVALYMTTSVPFLP